jgi:hypothetical protein
MFEARGKPIEVKPICKWLLENSGGDTPHNLV